MILTNEVMTMIQPHNERPSKVWSSGGDNYNEVSRGIADSIEHAVLRLNPRPGEKVLDLAAAQIELPLEKIGIHLSRTKHQQVLDTRPADECDFAQGIGIHRDIAPADPGDTPLFNDLRDKLLDFIDLR